MSLFILSIPRLWGIYCENCIFSCTVPLSSEAPLSPTFLFCKSVCPSGLCSISTMLITSHCFTLLKLEEKKRGYAYLKWLFSKCFKLYSRFCRVDGYLIYKLHVKWRFTLGVFSILFCVWSILYVLSIGWLRKSTVKFW